MIRFLCFYSPITCHKPKKIFPLSTKTMHQATKECTSDQDSHESNRSVVQDPKTGQFKTVKDTEKSKGADTMEPMRRSMSLGSDLVDYEGRTSADGYSVDYDEYASTHNTHTESVTELNDKDLGTSLCDENHKTQTSDSRQISSNMVNHESVLSMGYQQQSDDDYASENCESRFSGTYTSDMPSPMMKSNSLPFLDTSFSKLVHESQSSDDLKGLERVDDNNITSVERSTTADDSSDSYNYVGSAKDWIVPGVDESSKAKNVQEEHLVSQWEGLANRDFKIKRIEKWVMDLDYTPVSETNGPVKPVHRGKTDKTIVLDTSKIDKKNILGMEAAKRYISSLSRSSSAAHLANHGLVAIPLLTPFASLKELNLSGNAIVRITVGVLPRGLHILNLSKNSISVIEGLRELTRLRSLDLNYNRILRIGHGLASCSLLKELYLAGNKISEVEGLHRLLKLKVLDLRFNKLSTTKSLGQLAANYNSLQAIGLEGNPAQKNIGDEQLKKYLTGLLPHLAYYNRNTIKPGSIKDSVDRSPQLGLFDRGRNPTHGRKTQAASSRGRHVRLPPSGMKTVTAVRHDHASNNKRPTFRPEAVIRRTRSDGVLSAP